MAVCFQPCGECVYRRPMRLLIIHHHRIAAGDERPKELCCELLTDGRGGLARVKEPFAFTLQTRFIL